VTATDVRPGRIVARVEDGIGWLTFDNPARRNALSVAMLESVPGVVGALGDDQDVRVVVMTGAGEKAFVSGADISEFGNRRTELEARREYDAVSGAAMKAWEALEKPVVAMIRGYCIGGGVLTALQADLRVASDDSRFAIPAARLGLGYSLAGVERLLAVVGPAWAAEILFTARRLGSAEALAIGLVNRLTTSDGLEAAVRELAGQIAENAPLTVRACKVALRQAQRSPAQRELGRLDELISACYASEDYREGQRAFLEKRPPRFTGR
jgi:enoyl-CoA hydratase/carnithine racemase